MPAVTGSFIGLMSGTSMDAVDAVLLHIGEDKPEIIAHHAIKIPSELKQKLLALSQPGNDNLDLLGETDREAGELFAETANQLLDRIGLTHEQITAIGTHGQTVRHRPASNENSRGFTLQIGDPNIIASLTGITTVADFRRKDMALGGQGAPLVPAFHKSVFQHASHNRAVINIGGIANITWLPASNKDSQVLGFDTGPGNCLMDSWIYMNLGDPFDTEGAWAGNGQLVHALLDLLMSHPFINTPPPKSTGREIFNLTWLETMLAQLTNQPPAEDIQATLLQFTAQTIHQGLHQLPGAADEIFICGGGVNNRLLMEKLSILLPGVPIFSTRDAGIDPQHVEAAAFAWLAYRRINNLPGSLADVTGASRDAVLGCIYLPG